jgi:uncharacterized membrane protein
MHRNSTRILVIIILVVYAVIALIHCNAQGFWHDEIHTLTFLKGISAYDFEGSTLFSVHQEFPIQFCKEKLHQDNFVSNFSIPLFHEGHPPFYFLSLKPWAMLFGYSELSLRSFSLFSGLLSTIVLYRISKENFIGKFVPLAVVLFVIFNPFLFYFFTEARMYAFAFLMAIIVFRYWLKYQKHQTFNSFDFIVFSISSTALLFTHYYGLFFICTLAFWDLITNGVSPKLLRYSVPILLFSPWLIVIIPQLGFHEVHWTDGAFSFFDSLEGFLNNITNLFFSPMSLAKPHEKVLTLFLIVSLIVFSRRSWRRMVAFILGIFIYFLQLFFIDQVFDHHSIIVPRYYIFILILFFWAMAESIQNIPRVLGYALLASYCIVAGYSTQEIYSSKRAPKQMYRELAGYIETHHDAANTLIVVEPNGPIVWGLAYYLKEDFSIVIARGYNGKTNKKNTIYVDELLGVSYCEGRYNNEEQKKLRLVPFVGVSIYE